MDNPEQQIRAIDIEIRRTKNKIAFILSIFFIHKNYHSALFDIFNNFNYWSDHLFFIFF